jgi:hypothetical protein
VSYQERGGPEDEDAGEGVGVIAGQRVSGSGWNGRNEEERRRGLEL